MSIFDTRISVLLIEDDVVDIKNIQYGFQAFDIKNRLFIANSAMEALDILHAKKTHPHWIPSLIILDINMPMMNGFEFLSMIRKHKSLLNIPVIIITTSDLPQDIQKAKAFNVVGYFIKPLVFDQFFHLYKRLIEGTH